LLRGRWNSTVSVFTSRNESFKKSQTRLMSRRAMWRTVIIGPPPEVFFFLLRLGAIAVTGSGVFLVLRARATTRGNPTRAP
jgi:hypothetical protein